MIDGARAGREWGARCESFDFLGFSFRQTKSRVASICILILNHRNDRSSVSKELPVILDRTRHPDRDQNPSDRLQNVASTSAGQLLNISSDTPEGSTASAAMFSLVETAMTNGLEPYAYLPWVIGNISTADTDEALDALMPWKMK